LRITRVEVPKFFSTFIGKLAEAEVLDPVFEFEGLSPAFSREVVRGDEVAVSDEEIMLQWHEISEQLYIALGSRVLKRLPPFLTFLRSDLRGLLAGAHAYLVLEGKQAMDH
jgi:hypothetical protein